jgi:hypothetical protein
VSTADAVSREAAWLNTTSDSLPYLPSSAGGPWEIVQAYWPGSRLASQKTGIYVLRGRATDPRVANLRIRPQYTFTLKLWWPIRATGPGIAETEQQNLDDAVDDLIQRIRGPVEDKTHGGRFLSVGEVPGVPFVDVVFDDPEHTIKQDKTLRASVTYYADDIEIDG